MTTETTAPKITSARLTDDGQRLRLALEIGNPSTRTLHLYRTLRAIRYFPAERRLEVQLSDRGLDELDRLGNFIFPRFVSVDPGGRTSLSVPLPRVITRVDPDQPPGARTPDIQSLPAHEAEVVDVEIAWSGTPFYRDPRPGVSPRQMLVRWAQGHATLRLHRSTDQDGGPGSDPGAGPDHEGPVVVAPRRGRRGKRRP
jgi:hypothetical protein